MSLLAFCRAWSPVGHRATGGGGGRFGRSPVAVRVRRAAVRPRPPWWRWFVVVVGSVTVSAVVRAVRRAVSLSWFGVHSRGGGSVGSACHVVPGVCQSVRGSV